MRWTAEPRPVVGLGRIGWVLCPVEQGSAEPWPLRPGEPEPGVWPVAAQQGTWNDQAGYPSQRVLATRVDLYFADMASASMADLGVCAVLVPWTVLLLAPQPAGRSLLNSRPAARNASASPDCK